MWNVGKVSRTVILALIMSLAGINIAYASSLPEKTGQIKDCDDEDYIRLPDDDEEEDDDENDNDNDEDRDSMSKNKKKSVSDNDDEEDDDDEDDSEDEDEEDDEDDYPPLVKLTDYSGRISAYSVLVCGNKYVISANFTPEKFMISDKRIIKINKHREVIPKKEGDATIVAVGPSGETVTCQVSVEKPKMKSKKVSVGSVTDIMDMVEKTYEAYPSEIIIDNPSIASIDKETGELTALSKGKTKVTLMFGAKKMKKNLKVV